jgi:ABC-type nitrate/sulfonate/bicarbonate transport system substrate-binding protein
MKRLTKVLALVLTLSMVAAACGSDDEEAAPAATTAATTAAPAATTAAPAATTAAPAATTAAPAPAETSDPTNPLGLDLSGKSVTVTTGLADSLSGTEFFMFDRLAEWGLSIDEVVLTQTSGLETLLAGAADISTGASDESLMGLAQGADPVIIGSPESKVNYVLVAKTEHKTIEDLRDGILAISGPGGFNTLLSNMAVRSVGLEPGIDVELSQIGGSPERSAALLAGQVDAASVFLADWLELDAASDNLHVLARYADIIPEPGSSTWFSVGGYWAANPDIALAFACANLQANRWANENRSDYIEMILERVDGTTRGPTEQMYDQAVLVDMWPVDPSDVIRIEYLQNLNSMLVSTGDLEAEVDLSTVLDTSYLEAADAGGC